MELKNYLYRWILLLVLVPILSYFFLLYFEYITKIWNTDSRLKKWLSLCIISFLLLVVLFFRPK